MNRSNSALIKCAKRRRISIVDNQTNNQPMFTGANILAGATTVAKMTMKIVTPVAAAAAGTVIGMIAFSKYFKKD